MLKKSGIYISLLLLFFLSPACSGQELICSVDVVSPNIQDASAQLLFKNMKDEIYQFMNNTKFTNDNFTNQEKIECKLFLNMSPGNSPSDFSATMQVQASRPVYKSSYNSTLMNFQDNFVHIVYQLNQPIIFNINSYSDNLTAILSFYAYMIIGNDYDSFSLDGGTPYFLKAQSIVSNAQNSGEKGWNPQDGDQTRYWMVNNTLDENYFGPLRKAMYDYHRQGLDIMYTDAQKGRQAVMAALAEVQDVFNAKPANFNVLIFFNAKATEIANIFSEATSEEKTNVLAILNAIDATDAPTYEKLKNSKD
jgi:hypothetical protein